MTDEQFITIVSLLENIAANTNNAVMMLEEIDANLSGNSPTLETAPAAPAETACASFTRSGDRCSVKPIRGTSYCIFHKPKP